jgi:hypothetical protein
VVGLDGTHSKVWKTICMLSAPISWWVVTRSTCGETAGALKMLVMLTRRCIVPWWMVNPGDAWAVQPFFLIKESVL